MSDTPTTAPGPEIHRRLAAILAGVKAITKDRVSGKDGGPQFKYRGVDDVYNELHHLFAEQQIYVRPEVLDWKQTDRQTANGKMQIHAIVRMRYHFTATDGSSVAMEAVGECADNGDKSLGKAMQYAFKTILLQANLIPTEEDNDPDAQSTEWASQQKEAAAKRPPASKPPAHEAAADALRKAKDTARVKLLMDEAAKRPEMKPHMSWLEGIAAVKLSELHVVNDR